MEGLVKCSLALSKSDYRILMFFLENDESYTVKDLSEKLGLDRTTIQKSLKNLIRSGVLGQFQENLSPGGYRYIYKINEKEIIKDKIKQIINDWNNNVLKAIENW